MKHGPGPTHNHKFNENMLIWFTQEKWLPFQTGRECTGSPTTNVVHCHRKEITTSEDLFPNACS